MFCHLRSYFIVWKDCVLLGKFSNARVVLALALILPGVFDIVWEGTDGFY